MPNTLLVTLRQVCPNPGPFIGLASAGYMIKRLMSSPKCKSVEIINNPARPGSNHGEVNCINYK